MPTLTPVDFDPFYEATGADKPEQPKSQVKLLANSLFSAVPYFGAVLGNEEIRNSFMEGVKKSGASMLKGMGEALENQYVPEGAVKFDDAGQYYDKDNKPLFTQRRPNLVPLTKDEKGEVELAMPAMADVWNTLGAPVKGAVGAGPALYPALKYMDKIYKAKKGEQHLDALPKELQETFQKQAMSGEDISNFNFGFINHKGHFLQREDALKYAIDHGILDPSDAKYGTLVTTMLNQSGGEGKLTSTFFSALEDNLNKINQNKASGEQWLNTLSNAKGVKGEEIEWTGLKDFLAGKKNVTKGEIQDYLKENQVQLNDVWKGLEKGPFGQAAVEAHSTLHQELVNKYGNGIRYKATPEELARLDDLDNRALIKNPSPTKYKDYQLPGGENYRELLMTLPNKLDDFRNTQKANETRIKELREGMRGTSGSNEIRAEISKLQNENQAIQQQIRDLPLYKSSHWDEPNILAHMRMNDRTIDGKKSLHLEEIQSDWHQQGREKGYKGQPVNTEGWTATQNKNGSWDVRDKNGVYVRENIFASDDGLRATDAQSAIKIASKEPMQGYEGVPDAPFKKTWHELALKRAIREAAENGYERLSWTPGEAQAARYDLSKQLKELQYLKHEDGTYEIAGITSKGDGFNHPDKVTAARLPDIVGKEMAEKIIKNEGKRNRGQPSNGGYFEGVDLKIGGEGMKGFYDQIIPKSVEKIAKEFGVKVQKGEVGKSNNTNYRIENDTGKINSATDKYPHAIYYDTPKGEKKFLSAYATEKEAKEALVKLEKDKQPIFYIDIPPAMRQAVMQKGQPLFSGTPTLTPVNYNPFEEETK